MAGAAAKSGLGKSRFKGSQVGDAAGRAVEVTGFAVANVKDMQVHAAGMVFASQAEARQRGDASSRPTIPKLSGTLQVAAEFEVAA